MTTKNLCTRGSLSPGPPGIFRFAANREGVVKKNGNAALATLPPSPKHLVRRSGCVPAEPYPPTKQINRTKGFSSRKENVTTNNNRELEPLT